MFATKANKSPIAQIQHLEKQLHEQGIQLQFLAKADSDCRWFKEGYWFLEAKHAKLIEEYNVLFDKVESLESVLADKNSYIMDLEEEARERYKNDDEVRSRYRPLALVTSDHPWVPHPDAVTTQAGAEFERPPPSST